MSEMTIQEAVRMMSEQMANMYYYLTREMVNALGKEEAKKYIHKAIVDFGHNRGKKIAAKALEAGLIVITAGSNVLRFVPPLIIEEKDVDEMISRLESIL